jgi:predicted esterase
LNAVVIRVSATHARPSGGYSWDEYADVDALQLQYAEDYVRAKLNHFKVGPRLMFGFSQGAQMALEIAAQYPDRFAGAAAFSPGTLAGLELQWLDKRASLRNRHFLIRVNDEHPLNQRWAGNDAKRLQDAGGIVDFKTNKTITAHTVPPNYVELLLAWAMKALKSQ